MQIDLKPDEQLTRKEYLKRKKKQNKKANFTKKSKLIYIMPIFLILLSVYVCIQYYIYHQANSFKYTEDESVKTQKVYKTYYVTEGYTYDPVYSLNSVNSDGFEDGTVLANGGLTDIYVDASYIYGLKQAGLYRLSKETNELECLVEKDVFKYTLYQNRIYFICKENSRLKYIDLTTKEIKDLNLDNITEVLVDDNHIFVVQDEKTKKTLIRYDKEGQNKHVFSGDINVSYIIQDTNTIFFVNKKDANKIYQVKKDGTSLSKVEDISSISDNGDIKEIDGKRYMFSTGKELFFVNKEDGNSLWKIDITTKEKSKVLSVNVEILQNVGPTIFYKVKNEMGVYLYNYESEFMSQVTKRKIKEFYVDTTKEVTSQKNKGNGFSRN